MLPIRLSLLSRLLLVAFLVLGTASLVPTAGAQPQGNSFTSNEYGFTVEWTDDWQIGDGGYDDYGIWLISAGPMAILIEGFDRSVLPGDLIVPGEGESVVLDESDGDPARGIFETDSGLQIYLESYSIDAGETIILVSLLTGPGMLGEAVEYAREEITVNGSPAITGAALDGSEDVGGVATEEVDPQPAVPGSFTSGLYGYSINYDPDTWEFGGEIHEGNVDGVFLAREGTSLTIWAWDAYGSDAVGCLGGEEAYYSQQAEGISDWTPVLDANGEPLRYESENLAWGVFSLTYTSANGGTSQLIDYISCEPIPGHDAVLIVLLSTVEGQYDTELELTLDILDTLEFDAAPDSGASQGNAGTEEGTVIEIDTNVAGSEYVSPTYGFTATIPLEWQIVDESSANGEDILVVSNGTSVVTLWATSAHGGDLEGCVDFAANASGLDLQLDTDASGDAFRGIYRNQAFGNFIYDSDGTTMMYFINCQPIPGTAAYLLLIQDVPYDEFTSERRFRSQIENSITMP